MGDEPSFDEFSESDVDEWRIEFEDNQDRITTLAYIAWQASKDDEATVVEL